ncbi:hypothetical protein PoB_001869100 [Plakobranchus ocellatus]|uniref:Uncharacterized protein n=1 Tax=Plakobranchus ocellatus TaxID=259542 RepID=A0AAV3ZC28_9GAST|nr:hypothetical protein PoB_001869100 [Plakobranchus ocellatus]
MASKAETISEALNSARDSNLKSVVDEGRQTSPNHNTSFILMGRRCRWSRPILERSIVPSRHDWHPMSAVTETLTGHVGAEKSVGKPRDWVAEGTA